MTTCCIILNYNDSETTISLLNAIKSYRSLDYIVIVDNMSTDGSFEELSKHKSNKIVVLNSGKNGGYGFGNNIGIRYAYEKLSAKYVVIANPDVEFKNETIATLVEAAKKQPDCAIIAAKVNQNTIAWKFTNSLHDVLNSSLLFNKALKSRYYHNDYFLNKKSVYVDIVPGSLLLVNAEKMIKYGMYDEEVFLFEEEKILAHKFLLHNLKTMLLLNITYDHNHSQTISKSIKNATRTKKILLDSRLLYLKKYKNLMQWQICLTKLFFCGCLLEMFFYSLIKRLLEKHYVQR